MEVILRATKKRVKRPVVKDHYWYDPETKQRLHGRGGRMVFIYDRVNQKQVPRILDDEHWVLESNFDDLIEFAKSNSFVQDINGIAQGSHVLIETPASSFSLLEDELRLNRILYDYDANEFHQEKSGKENKWLNSASKLRTRPLR